MSEKIRILSHTAEDSSSIVGRISSTIPGTNSMTWATATAVTAQSVANLIAEINGIKNYSNNRKETPMNNNSHKEIVDYKYEPVDKYDDKGNKTTYMKTTLTFRDGTRSSVESPANKADPYYGFYACYAKHSAGGNNKINDEAEYWIEILPKKLEKERMMEETSLTEEQRLAERDKKRREKQRVRMEAIRRKEAYDAAVLAHEKYGVPMDFTYKTENENK